LTLDIASLTLPTPLLKSPLYIFKTGSDARSKIVLHWSSSFSVDDQPYPPPQILSRSLTGKTRNTPIAAGPWGRFIGSWMWPVFPSASMSQPYCPDAPRPVPSESLSKKRTDGRAENRPRVTLPAPAGNRYYPPRQLLPHRPAGPSRPCRQ